MFEFFTEPIRHPTRRLLKPRSRFEWFLYDFQFELRVGLAGGILLGLFIIWVGSAMSMGMV